MAKDRLKDREPSDKDGAELTIPSSEVTPERVYFSRRKFLAGIGALAVSTFIEAACGNPGTTPTPAAGFCDGATASSGTDELGAPLTPCADITSFNNFYEFTTDKTAVAGIARNFKPVNWEINVGGLVKKPRLYGLEELLRRFPAEERIYRMRCVEGWSMVIPWLGFPLAKLLNEVEPESNAQFVRFETLYDPKQLPGQKDTFIDWPYVEGLRIDEAFHNLTLLATGLYGKPLPPQEGAPIRLVVPWKYGFKSIKSVVKIDLVAEMPVSTWMKQAPEEYGFYANVNPDVSHPRWSQSTEWRIGKPDRLKTMLYNGYSEAVATLYKDMDLRINF